MRWYDWKRIELLVFVLESGKTPTEKQIKDARAALDREKEILLKRQEQQAINLSRRYPI